MSHQSEYLLMMRRKQDIHGKARDMLRLLIRARGPVTHRLIGYHVWRCRGRYVPSCLTPYISHIRTITGLGIRHHIEAESYALDPEENQHWCVPEVWEAVGADRA